MPCLVPLEIMNRIVLNLEFNHRDNAAKKWSLLLRLPHGADEHWPQRRPWVQGVVSVGRLLLCDDAEPVTKPTMSLVVPT